MGILRPDRSDEHNKYVGQMLPYGLIYRHGAPPQSAILTWVRTCGIFFLGKQGVYEVTSETQYFQLEINRINTHPTHPTVSFPSGR